MKPIPEQVPGNVDLVHDYHVNVSPLSLTPERVPSLSEVETQCPRRSTIAKRSTRVHEE